MAERTGGEVAAHLARGDSIVVSVLPKETAWYINSELYHGLVEGGIPPVGSGSARYEGTFGFIGAVVRYENPRHEGIFGSKIVDREVSVSVSAHVIDRNSGQIVLASDFDESYRDTIVFSAIPQVENPNLPPTKGALPAEGFFSNFVEPVVVLGAIAVAVLLLFKIRS